MYDLITVLRLQAKKRIRNVKISVPAQAE